MSVCLSVRSRHTAVARSSSDGVAIRSCTSGFVDNVTVSRNGRVASMSAEIPTKFRSTMKTESSQCEGGEVCYVIVTPLSTMGYTIVASVFQ